jgi:hypothetical protein
MKKSNSEKSPKTAEEQDSPQPERMVTPQEEAGQSIQELENPPQAEGPRDERTTD